MCVYSVVSHLFAIPWTVAHQAPLSMGFPRQEYSSGLPLPTPGNLPAPGIKPKFPGSLALAGRFFTTEPSGKPHLSGEVFFKIYILYKSPLSDMQFVNIFSHSTGCIFTLCMRRTYT